MKVIQLNILQFGFSKKWRNGKKVIAIVLIETAIISFVLFPIPILFPEHISVMLIIIMNTNFWFIVTFV